MSDQPETPTAAPVPATDTTPVTTTTTGPAATTTTPAPSTTTTPASSTPPFAPISADEIAAFADKLAQSGAALPPAQQALLQMIVTQARAITPADVRAQELRQGFAAALTSVVTAQAQAWGDGPAADGWVKIDPIWIKAGDTATGGAMEVTASIVVGAGPAA